MSASAFRALVASFFVLLFAAPPLALAQNDPAVQFSPINNPNGVWKYGYENFPLPNPFNLLTLPGPVSGVDGWRSPSFGQVGVYHNGSAAVVNFLQPGDNALYQPNELGMHPGPNDQYGVVQFTAPVAGQYKIHGTFEGLDTGGTNTFVSLLVNNLPMINGNVIGFGPISDVPLSFGPVFLNPGDTMAFATGGNPTGGSTGLLPGAAVDAVPEPSSLALVGAAIVSLVSHRRRSKSC